MTVDASDRSAVLERITRAHAALKIVLKIKDDPFFLGQWIAHHGAMVGHENLIVLDNGSTDPDVLGIYAHHKHVPVLPVDGFYNDVHFPARFADFYAALRSGCDAFLFLDTDEFLAYYDADRFRWDTGALAPVYGGIRGDFIPTTRLNAVPLYRGRFTCATDRLRHELKWGKPIMRAASEGWPELINHNIHLKGALQAHVHPGYFVLHRPFLSPDQRIRNNVNKLIARGFMKPHEPLDKVLARDAPDDAWQIRIYLDEIRRMHALQRNPAPDDAPLAPGTMRIAGDGAVAFASRVEERAFRSYLETFAYTVGELIQA